LSGLRFCIEKCIGEDKVLEKLIFQVNLFLNHHESTREVVKETNISPMKINVKPKHHPNKKGTSSEKMHLYCWVPALGFPGFPGRFVCCLPWRIKPKKVLKNTCDVPDFQQQHPPDFQYQYVSYTRQKWVIHL